MKHSAIVPPEKLTTFARVVVPIADLVTRHLTVVGLTACAMKGDEAAALNAGCDGYLTKPINTRTFMATLRSFMASAHLRQTKHPQLT